ncbi:hypothetical protein [Hydrocarboniphaga effusa]|uniref:Tyr recombinase domain-containing protein n=1 Tax=Hydrocarboniphaga effusa AP103 TaxID=1172194 RepID=I7Z9L2_9GAMM|nr:hypothetical protein [Hydrocarboniphaga effusa]EIT68367.1 hypothetical protein WQQ_35620 [Hydrocarboniphaga effusa AP103]
MNPRFEQLSALLSDRLGVGQQEVLDVLFMLRAHQNLAAIVYCCRRLVELLEAVPEFDEAEPAFPDQAQRLRLIRQIALLDEKDVDPHFLNAHIDRNRARKTPLRPHTGDSGLCDLLLIQPKERASEEQKRAFEWLQAWFAWQMFQHQRRVHAPKKYERYLNGEVLDLKDGLATRVYGALRVLRELADIRHASRAVETASQLQGLTAKASTQLSQILKLAHTESGLPSVRKALSDSGMGETDLDARIEGARKVSAEIGRLLQLIWMRSSAVERDQTALRKDIARQVRKVEVDLYGHVTIIGHELDVGSVHAGFAIEIVEHEPLRPEDEVKDQGKGAPVDKGKDRGKGALVDEEEDQSKDDLGNEGKAKRSKKLIVDPGDGEGVEPSTVLFLAKGEPMAGWYAAKSALHHIERANALLPWPDWRLSVAAIEAVVGCVVLKPADSSIEQRARLSIGLSLLTGRSLDFVSGLAIGRSSPSAGELKQSVVISKPDYMVHVLAGLPELADCPDLPEFCAPAVKTLRLPLPVAWRPLVDVLDEKPHRRHSTILEQARSLIATLPKSLGITPRAIAGALKLALLERGRDDLALVKVLIDANDANLNNLIHYASYERKQVEQLWREIVAPWAGPLGEPPSVEVAGERVGCPQGFEVAKVAAQIAKLKARFKSAVREQRWPAVYNNLSMYLSIWLGLATAGRRSREPVPGIITADGWALVRDKSRPDGSTDRYVPLGRGVLEQLDVLRSLASALSIIDPGFAGLSRNPDHILSLRIFDTVRNSVPFQPRFMDLSSTLKKLPGNWGRKLVRSCVNELSGRMKDAGLGHWVRGRHPWTWTSTFPSAEFRAQWLAMQESLERDLGFEVLRIEDFPDPRPWPNLLPAPPRLSSAPIPPPVLSDEAVVSLLREGPEDLFEAAFEWEPPSPEAALGLVRDVLRTVADRPGVDLPAYAERICEYIRIRTNIPLFASRPRSRFQRNWLVSSHEFGCLAYLQQSLLPAIAHDLAHLPAVADGEQALQIDTGRLIVAAALRGGLLCVPHLDAFLTFIAGDEPVQAVGDVRLIELKVRAVRTGDLMRRTVLLDPYLSALIAVERVRVADALRPLLKSLSSKRQEHWNNAFRAYLRSLGLPDEMRLPDFLLGLRQQMQLAASPVLAAYASGEILTEDLAVREFRRLAGLGPVASKDEEETQAEADPDSELGEPLPSDLKQRDYARTIGDRTDVLTSEWLGLLSKDIEASQSLSQKLLCRFAYFMVEEYEREHGPNLSKRARKMNARILRVVWHGLVGFADTRESWTQIDEAILQTLWDLTSPHFPARTHHGAWTRFRTFLTNRQDALEKDGFIISKIADSARRVVSAKILSAVEIRRIEERLKSVSSRIGTAKNRVSASRHFRLTEATGARRAETEKLRWADLDGDMIRIREYEGRTLKTASSERVVPVALAGDALLELLEAARAIGAAKPLDAGPDHDASGDNFFDRVAKSMKSATGDPDIGPHHLRHTKASVLLLLMLANIVDFDLLKDLPWVAELMPTPAQREILLASAGQCGQGLKAICALLGHLHETTTLRHYIHTLCVALYAYQVGLPEISLKAFALRSSSRATWYRLAKQCEEEGVDAATTQRRLRDRIELDQQKECARGDSSSATRLLVFRDETPLQLIETASEHEPKTLADAEGLKLYFEHAHQYLMGERGDAPDGVDALRGSLQKIAEIPSGKRGSNLMRHPMELRTPEGSPMPDMIGTGARLERATDLLCWLLNLKKQQDADYRWLLDKWLYASEALEGSMRLDGSDEVRIQSLPADERIHLEIRNHRLRIRFPGDPLETGRKSVFKGQASSVIRWVMTWMAASENAPK